MSDYTMWTTDRLLRTRELLAERIRKTEDDLPRWRDVLMGLDNVIRHRAESDAKTREKVET